MTVPAPAAPAAIPVEKKVFDLEADSGDITSLAGDLNTLGSATLRQSEALEGHILQVVEDWEGDDREAWALVHRQLSLDVGRLSAFAETVHKQLSTLGRELLRAQSDLNDFLASAKASCPDFTEGPDGLVFRPKDEIQEKDVRYYVEQALDMRAVLDSRSPYGGVDSALVQEISGRWAQGSANLGPGSSLGPEADTEGSSAYALRDGSGLGRNRVTVNTGTGPDRVQVSTYQDDDGTRKARVVYNDKTEEFDAIDLDLVINSGSGNDIVDVENGPGFYDELSVTVIGGEGNDDISTARGSDTIIAGPGKNKVDPGDNGYDWVDNGDYGELRKEFTPHS